MHNSNLLLQKVGQFISYFLFFPLKLLKNILLHFCKMCLCLFSYRPRVRAWLSPTSCLWWCGASPTPPTSSSRGRRCGTSTPSSPSSLPGWGWSSSSSSASAASASGPSSSSAASAVRYSDSGDPRLGGSLYSHFDLCYCFHSFLYQGKISRICNCTMYSKYVL